MVTTLKDVAATALDTGRDVKDSVAEFVRSASGRIDTVRDQTGDALHAAASSVRKGSAKIDVMAGDAASRLDTTASFVKDADLKSLSVGVRRFGQTNLTLTVLVAAAAGLWVGIPFGKAARKLSVSAIYRRSKMKLQIFVLGGLLCLGATAPAQTSGQNTKSTQSAQSANRMKRSPATAGTVTGCVDQQDGHYVLRDVTRRSAHPIASHRRGRRQRLRQVRRPPGANQRDDVVGRAHGCAHRAGGRYVPDREVASVLPERHAREAHYATFVDIPLFVTK